MGNKSTRERFINKANLKHDNKYNYNDVVYVDRLTGVLIKCGIHGNFTQIPAAHLRGQGCPLCKGNRISETKRKKFTLQDFLDAAVKVHGNKYDYSQAEYTTAHKKIKIICKQHGVFEQSHANHAAGKGCPKCMRNGYNRAKSGYIYVLVADNLTKIGITNREICTRVASISKSSGHSFKLIFSRFFENGEIPYRIESQILKELRLQYKQTQSVFDGSTECFTDVNTESLISRVNELNQN